MAVASRNVLYHAPSSVASNTPVTIRFDYTVRGTGNRAPVGSKSGSVRERFIVRAPGGGPVAAPVTTRDVLYNAVEGDVGNTVVIRGDFTFRKNGRIVGFVTARESFEVISRDARVPTLEFGGSDRVEADGATYQITLIPTGGNYDTIRYEWDFNRFSAGTLVPDPDDSSRATYTAPSRNPHADTTYCVAFTIKVMVAGNGTNANENTFDEAEYKFEFEIS